MLSLGRKSQLVGPGYGCFDLKNAYRELPVFPASLWFSRVGEWGRCTHFHSGPSFVRALSSGSCVSWAGVCLLTLTKIKGLCSLSVAWGRFTLGPAWCQLGLSISLSNTDRRHQDVAAWCLQCLDRGAVSAKNCTSYALESAGCVDLCGDLFGWAKGLAAKVLMLQGGSGSKPVALSPPLRWAVSWILHHTFPKSRR